MAVIQPRKPFNFCITCSNSIFDNEYYLQIDGTAQGSNMSCSYTDIALPDFVKEAIDYHLSHTKWKRFRDDVFVFDVFINTLDPTKKIKFAMEVAEPGNYSEFFELKWEDGK